MNRPTLEQCMMQTAFIWAGRSVCSRLNVGCVITNSEMTSIEAIGYNGKAKGEGHEPDSEEPGKTGMVHAEENALIKADYKTKNKKIFVTHSPCLMCSRKIINGDIKEVYFQEAYRDLSPLKKLVDAKIKVFKLFENGDKEELSNGNTIGYEYVWQKISRNGKPGDIREFTEGPTTTVETRRDLRRTSNAEKSFASGAGEEQDFHKRKAKDNIEKATTECPRCGLIRMTKGCSDNFVIILKR